MKSNKVQGIIYILFAGFFFSLMSFFVRLAGDLPTVQKAFFRNAVAAIVAITILARSDEGFKIKKGSLPFLIMRATCGLIGIFCNFYAISKIGLADSNMLNKLSPFFAMIFSIFVLGERSRYIDWIMVIIAFCGALFVIKPSSNVTSLYGFIGMLGGLGAGVAYTFVRKLGTHGERGPVIVAFFSVFSSLVCLPIILFTYKPMTGLQWFYLIMAGISAMGGQLTITQAYTKAPAKEISVFDYSQIIFAALLGMVFFNELPDKYSLLGYAIIIGVAIFKWQYNLKHD